MSWGLPKQPGMTFTDPTKSRFHMRSSFRLVNGYVIPDQVVLAPGRTKTDVDSSEYAEFDDSCGYDPSLTYGRVKQPAPDAVIPHFVHYDKKALKFRSFLKQSVYESPDEAYCVRFVDIVYFLEDDTMTVMEPRVRTKSPPVSVTITKEEGGA